MSLHHSGSHHNAGLSPASLTGATLFGLAEHLGSVLQEQGWYLSTAESCTGGLLAGAVTSAPGSSGWFDRGFITYSNQAKIDELQVSADTLNHFGAVSEEAALEMAQGVLLASPLSHLAIATTGIAGPGGATAGKPVGMVCFGFARRTKAGINSRAVTHVFTGDRSQVRLAAVEFALRGILELAPAGPR